MFYTHVDPDILILCGIGAVAGLFFLLPPYWWNKGQKPIIGLQGQARQRNKVASSFKSGLISGLILLFVFPPLGFIVLACTLLKLPLTAATRAQAERARQTELLERIAVVQAPLTPAPPSATPLTIEENSTASAHSRSHNGI